MKHFVKSDIVSVGAGVDYVVGEEPEAAKGDMVVLKKKGPGLSHVRKTTFRGLPINVELDTGMVAEGKDPDGKPWRVTYQHPYGEIAKTMGRDGDPVDVYLGPDEKAEDVYVIHQVKRDGSFDEDKCMLGFSSSKAATKCYFDHGPKWGYGSSEALTFEQFRDGYLAGARETAKSLIIRG